MKEKTIVLISPTFFIRAILIVTSFGKPTKKWENKIVGTPHFNDTG